MFLFDKLRSVRISQRKTCADLSAALGFQTRGAYYKKESGAVPFTLREAKIVADCLGEHVEDIFFDDEVSC